MKKLIIITSFITVIGLAGLANAYVLPGLIMPTTTKINYDVVTEKTKDSIITKQVCYKKDGKELVISSKTVVVADEVKKIDAQIATLQVQKESILNSVKP